MKIKSWIALLLLALSGFSEYYVYDSLTSIDSLVKEALNFSAADFGLLYSFYSVGNVFFAALFFAGILIDLWGYKKSGFLFASLCLVGAALTAYGASTLFMNSSFAVWLSEHLFKGHSASLVVMLFARVIFGVGAEALLIAIMVALVSWFGEKKVAFAYAAAILFYRFGTYLALILQSKIALQFNYQVALWFAVIIMGLGWLCYIIYMFFDHYKHSQTPHLESEPFKIKKVFHFPIVFWYLTLISFTYYGGITSFEIFDPDFLKYRFGFSIEKAGSFSSFMLLATMIFMPLFGLLVDKIGKRATMMLLGSSISVLSLLALMLFSHPKIPIFILGIGYSFIAASVWASVPLVIEKKYQGTAFGIMAYIQNVGLMIFPWISGIIADLYTTKWVENGKQMLFINYIPLIIFFIILIGLSFILAVLLKIKDRYSKGRLHSLEEAK